MEAHAIANEKPFSHTMEVFDGLLRKLEGPEWAALPHGKVEQALRVAGWELLRVMYEDHLNLRAQAQPETPVVGSDGETRTHRRAMSRKLMSIFGVVEFRLREGWRGDGLEALCPLDAELNLPPTIDSHGVRRRVAELASKVSFDVVGEELGKTSGATVGKRQLEELTHEMSRDFDAFYEVATAEVVDESATLLIGLVDATGLAMRPEALREATRRQREAETASGERWPKPKGSSDMDEPSVASTTRRRSMTASCAVRYGLVADCPSVARRKADASVRDGATAQCNAPVSSTKSPGRTQTQSSRVSSTSSGAHAPRANERGRAAMAFHVVADASLMTASGSVGSTRNSSPSTSSTKGTQRLCSASG